MIAHRHGLVAALLGFLMALGIGALPAPAECPEGRCPLPAPTALRWAASTPTELQVTWDDVPRAFAYRVQLTTDPAFSGNDVISTTSQQPSASGPVVFKELTPGTIYHARVSVLDKALQQQSHWTEPTTYATKGAMNVSVGTYNIGNPDDTWGTRAPWIAEGIVGQKVNVLGVQEAYQTSDRLSLLQQVNARGTQVGIGPVYGMAPAAESPLGYDNRILYDSRAVALLYSGAQRYAHQVGDGEADRWFSWAAFKHRRSSWSFLFVTTHLAPGDDDVDVQQWNELIAGVSQLKRTLNVPWVVVAGDFNTTKFEKPAKAMLPRMQAAGFGDILGQQYRTYDTSGARALVTKDAWLNSFNGFRRDLDKYDVDEDRNGNGVDWIFASNDLLVPYYRVYARYDDDELIEPIPSDHFLVWAALAYTPPPQ